MAAAAAIRLLSPTTNLLKVYRGFNLCSGTMAGTDVGGGAEPISSSIVAPTITVRVTVANDLKGDFGWPPEDGGNRLDDAAVYSGDEPFPYKGRRDANSEIVGLDAQAHSMPKPCLIVRSGDAKFKLS